MLDGVLSLIALDILDGSLESSSLTEIFGEWPMKVTWFSGVMEAYPATMARKENDGKSSVQLTFKTGILQNHTVDMAPRFCSGRLASFTKYLVRR